MAVNISNAAAVTFGANAGLSQTITHIGIGFAAAGAGVLYGSKTLDDSRVIAVAAVANFAIGEIDIDLTSTSFEGAFLTLLAQHYFQNADHTSVGDAAGLQNSAATGNVYVSLHVSDPAGGDQTTGEGTLGRVAVARSAVGWTVA
jgi:hypothetical protein